MEVEVASRGRRRREGGVRGGMEEFGSFGRLGVVWGFRVPQARRLAAQVSEKERERDRGKQKSRPFSFPVAVLLCPSNFDVILIFFS